jgi:glycerate dehydrogenase
MKIVILDSRPLTQDDAAWEPLKAVADVEVYEHSSEQQAQARARDAAVLITNRVPVTAHLIEHAPELRLIAVSFTGYDLVDVVFGL